MRLEPQLIVAVSFVFGIHSLEDSFARLQPTIPLITFRHFLRPLYKYQHSSTFSVLSDIFGINGALSAFLTTVMYNHCCIKIILAHVRDRWNTEKGPRIKELFWIDGQTQVIIILGVFGQRYSATSRSAFDDTRASKRGSCSTVNTRRICLLKASICVSHLDRDVCAVKSHPGRYIPTLASLDIIISLNIKFTAPVLCNRKGTCKVWSA